MMKGGTFFRTVWIAGRGTDRKCLATSDRGKAERLGRELLAAMLAGQSIASASSLTLGILWQRFRTGCPAFLDNAQSGQKDATTRAEFLIAYFGEEHDVRGLTAGDQAAYAVARRAGGIERPNRPASSPVRARSAEADLVLLHQMLRWAVTVRVGGVRILDANPLAGAKRDREKNPRRPVATWERYQATLVKVQQLQASASSELARRRWIKLEMALILAEATGRRLGSIRQLRWEDIEWEHRTIRWRAEADKKRLEAVVPVPEALLDALRRLQRMLSAVGGWCFAAESDPETPVRADVLKHWLRAAEKVAGLPKLNGGLWHAYRRKWATERKHLPIVDVAAAGGWRDTETLLRCYQQPTNDTLLAVMSEERKVHDRAIG
jgi:integrase